MTGETISHYRILEKLGEGGMGVVYQAEDLRLKRTVALKFLRVEGDEEHRERFRREAEAAAGLDHPNICTVYEVDEVDGQTFLAMAYIEGRDLGKKIAEGPLEIRTAINIARQMATGLREAHRRGVVHRDVKPGNVMLDEGSDGEVHVKLLDFGLAKLADRSQITRTEVTMGTTTYMAPEQALGDEVDARCDVWAVGVVLFEMIAGRPPFRGEYDKAVLYSVVNEPHPPITSLRADVPMDLEWILGKALAKDPVERYASIDDLIVDLRSLEKRLDSGAVSTYSRMAQTTPTTGVRPASGPAPASPAAASTAAGTAPTSSFGQAVRRSWKEVWRVGRESDRRIVVEHPDAIMALLAMLIVLLVGALGTAGWLWWGRPAPPEPPLLRFAHVPPAPAWGVRLSPDGRWLVYSAAGESPALWVQDLQDGGEPRRLAGTEGGRYPFWGPASRWIAFAAGATLKRVAVEGNSPSVICQLEDEMLGGAWSPDGRTLVFSAGEMPVLHRAPSQGGDATVLLGTDGEPLQGVTPLFLPIEGRRVMLYAAGAPVDPEVMRLDLDSGETQPAGLKGYPTSYASGHLLLQSGTNVRAVPFSLKSLEPNGDSFPVGLASSWPTAAENGLLAVLEGPVFPEQRFVWRNRDGERDGAVGESFMNVVSLDLSPGGNRLAFANFQLDFVIWSLDLRRGAATRLTFGSQHLTHAPTWAPDGSEIVYASTGKTEDFVLRLPLDGTSEPTPITERGTPAFPDDWARDGSIVLRSPLPPRDLLRLDTATDQITPLVSEPGAQSHAQVSPNGRWMIYASDESGTTQIYVRRYPGGERKTPVSRGGGAQPRWSHDGNEIYYVQDSTLMAVDFDPNGDPIVSAPKALFRSAGLQDCEHWLYDVAADGRFLIAEPDRLDDPPPIRLTLNWLSEQVR